MASRRIEENNMQDDLKIRQELIAEIERAFDGVSRGEGITLHQARAMDDWCDAKEQAEARTKDTETRWQDIPDLWIEELGDDFLFIHDPEGSDITYRHS